MTHIKVKIAYCPCCRKVLDTGQVTRRLWDLIYEHDKLTDHHALLVFQKLKENKPFFDYNAHYKKMMMLIYYDNVSQLQS